MDIAARLKHWMTGRNADAGLLLGVFENDPARVAAWLARGANANLRDWRDETLLFLAVNLSKDPAIAQHLLAHGADPRARERNMGWTPLHVAAAGGTEAHLRVLLDGGAEIDARDWAGWTPLHYAAANARLEEATFLVSRGSDVASRDREGRMPLDFAREHPFEDLGQRHRPAFERLLGGFLTAEVIETQSNALKVRVESLHSKYPEAERQARERGALILPCGLLDEVPEPGEILHCAKGLSRDQDKMWRAAHDRHLDIEPER